MVVIKQSALSLIQKKYLCGKHEHPICLAVKKLYLIIIVDINDFCSMLTQCEIKCFFGIHSSLNFHSHIHITHARIINERKHCTNTEIYPPPITTTTKAAAAKKKSEKNLAISHAIISHFVILYISWLLILSIFSIHIVCCLMSLARVQCVTRAFSTTERHTNAVKSGNIGNGLETIIISTEN